MTGICLFLRPKKRGLHALFLVLPIKLFINAPAIILVFTFSHWIMIEFMWMCKEFLLFRLFIWIWFLLPILLGTNDFCPHACWTIKMSINAKIRHVNSKQYAEYSMEIKCAALHFFGLTRKKKSVLIHQKINCWSFWCELGACIFFRSSIILEKCMEFLTFILWYW